MFQLKLLTILLLNQFLASFILYLRANIGGLHLFKTESFVSVLDKTILIGVCGLLLWGKITGGTFQIEWFVYAQSFSYLVTLLVALFIVMTREKNVFRFNFNLKVFVILLKKSLPFAVLVLLMSSYYRIDPVLLERMLPDGKTQAGIYAHSFRLLDMLQNYGYLFALILLPMFSRMLKNRQSVEQLVNISFVIIIIPALIVSAVSLFYSTEIISLLYHEHIEVSSRVFRIIMPSFTAICTSYIFGTLLTANGDLKTMIFIAGTGVVISITVNILLIPLIGVYGSAIANISAQFFTASIQLIAAVRLFRFRINYKLIIQLLSLTLLLLLAGSLSRLFTWEWYFRVGIYLVFSLVLIFALRIITIKTMTTFLSRAAD